ncbi:hypothetical protein AVXHC19_11500 [Acidovorax sacchari]
MVALNFVRGPLHRGRPRGNLLTTAGALSSGKAAHRMRALPHGNGGIALHRCDLWPECMQVPFPARRERPGWRHPRGAGGRVESN